MKLKINDYFKSVLSSLNTKIYPDLIKGVRGVSNPDNAIEHLMKPFLRAKHSLYVNKEGTIRYDCSELPITHFRPSEIGLSLEKLKELGYTRDIHNNPPVSEDQVFEIKPHDIVIPCCPDSPDEPSNEVLFRVSKFVDELLLNFYKMKPFYNLKTKKDLIGHYVIGLAPHTSAGVLCRIIGFSKTQGFFAHPYIHAAMRRDNDGDEACLILLLDAFLNFSKKFLPSSRGSTMDAALVLTYNLVPSEVDDMVFDIDIVKKYPLDFYRAAEKFRMPWDVDIKTIKNTLDTPEQYENMFFTHDSTSINKGVLCSAYKSLPTMEDKLKSQMDLAVKLKSVDESDVARLVIEKHFLKDIKGNLRKFTQQSFRCVKCNEIYRRPPLKGICLKCKGKIIFTVAEGSVVKYLLPSISLAEKFNVPKFIKED